MTPIGMKSTKRRELRLSDKGESICRNCGDRASHLHHAVPRSLSPAGKYDLRNTLPLCFRCHRGWHYGQITLHRNIFTTEEWACVSKLVGPTWLDRRYPSKVAA